METTQLQVDSIFQDLEDSRFGHASGVDAVTGW